jgi:sugar phosphate isomerase/epimerase
MSKHNVVTQDAVIAQSSMTVWHWPNHARWYDEGLRETLREIRRAGFSHINWNPDSGSSYWYAKSEIDFIAGCIADADLETMTLHASNGVNTVPEKAFLLREDRKDIHSPNLWQRQAAVELLQNRVDLAKALNCPNMVLHVDLRDCHHDSREAEEAFYGPLLETLDAVRPYCLEAGVKIAIENLTGASADNFLKSLL